MNRRRFLISAAFLTASASIMNNSLSGKRDYPSEFLSLFQSENTPEKSYSDFLNALEKGNITNIIAHDETLLIHERDSKISSVRLQSENHFLDLIRTGIVDPKAVNISFTKESSFLSNFTAPALYNTFVNYWEIPVFLLAGSEMLKEQDLDKRRKADGVDENTAYHEAGHAIAGLLRPGESDGIESATIIPDKTLLGHVAFSRPEIPLSSREKMYNELIISLAGRAAETVQFGEDKYTAGAMQDISEATEMADDMVRKCGMSDEIGPVDYSASDSLLSRLFTGRRPYSAKTLERLELERDKLLKSALGDAITLMRENKDTLDRVARAFLELKTLTGDQLEKLIKPETTGPEMQV